MKRFITLSTALVLAWASTASAGVTVSSSNTATSGRQETTDDLSFSPVFPRVGEICDLDVSGMSFWDLFGDPNNTVLNVDAAACVGLPSGTPLAMNGIGWDVEISTVGASWLSEATIYFDDNIAPDGLGLFLRPGAGNNAPGVGRFASGGILKLFDVGIADIPLPNGIVRVEFYDSYEDNPNAIDDNFGPNSHLFIQVTPEPTAIALVALGAVALLRRRR